MTTLTSEEKEDFIKSFIDVSLQEKLREFDYTVGDVVLAFIGRKIDPVDGIKKFFVGTKEATMTLLTLTLASFWGGPMNIVFPTNDTMEWIQSNWTEEGVCVRRFQK